MDPSVQEKLRRLPSEKCIEAIIRAKASSDTAHFPKEIKTIYLQSVMGFSKEEKACHLQRVINDQQRKATDQVFGKHLEANSLRLCNLPLPILTRILRCVFIPDPHHALVFEWESGCNIETVKHITETVPILRTSLLFYQIGTRILYGENTFTTATPSISYDLDRTLSRTFDWQRHLIKSISMQVDWGEVLWTKFPLIAVALYELKNLERLEISFVSSTPLATADLFTPHVQLLTDLQARLRLEAKRYKREETAAWVILNAEKKMFKDLVRTMRSLRTFRLVGFADEEFARQLEFYVEGQTRGTMISSFRYSVNGKLC